VLADGNELAARQHAAIEHDVEGRVDLAVERQHGALLERQQLAPRLGALRAVHPGTKAAV
jgi:hypothetical protein